MIAITEKTESEICAHGQSAYPFECCGVMLGKQIDADTKIISEVVKIVNAKNVEEQHNRFLITPDDIMKAELKARTLKLDVIGFYHSHPDHPAVPSQFDLDYALPFYSYVILSVERGQPREMSSWTMENDRTRFNPEFIRYKE